jgi:hypothetical protein
MTAQGFVKMLEATFGVCEHPALKVGMVRWLEKKIPEARLKALYDAAFEEHAYPRFPFAAEVKKIYQEMGRSGDTEGLMRTQAYLEDVRQEKLRLIDDGSGESERDQVAREIARLAKKLTGEDTKPPEFRVIKKAPPPKCSECGADISDQRKRLIDRCDCGEIIPEVAKVKREIEAQEKEKTG